ncbi:MAG: POT family-domain-containing protein [Monoraphidium minutum]|nr:MAG: POT family-domain-containing protein [Monoraphidium minutum]
MPQEDDVNVAELEEHFGASKDAADLSTDPLVPGRKRRIATACGCILGNEVCERLAYYGLQTNMGLYLKQYMGYPADTASQLLQAWKGTVYLTPVLGAFLADAYMGRFLVILVFSIVYLIGMGGVTAVNVIPSMKPRYMQPPASGDFGPSRAMFWAFLYLVALGSGGIKPCVSSFGGDQFRENSPRERGWRSSFFNWFYFAINIGSLVATLVVVRYGVGFGIPTAAMGGAIIIFILGAIFKMYTIVPPEGSPFSRMWKVLRNAFMFRKEPAPADTSALFEPAAGEKAAVAFRMAHTGRMAALDKAALRGKAAKDGYQVSMTEVEETKSFLGIMPIFLTVCIWQMTYDPIFSLLPYPGDVMDRQLGNSNFKIPASSISFANTFGVLLTIPLWDMVIVPMAIRFNRPISMTSRIGLGFIVQLLALLSAGFIELARYRMIRNDGLVDRWAAASAADPKLDYTDPAFTQTMSIWWQFIPYFLLGAAETFTNVGVLEMFFTQVSEGMRALGASFYLLSVAIGTYMATALNLIVSAAFPRDPWVADNPIYGHYDWYFFLNAVILALGYVAFLLVTRNFQEKPMVDESKDPFNKESRVHSDMANVTRAWPSVASRTSRMSELRARSSVTMRAAAGLADGGAKPAGARLATLPSQALPEA